MKNYDRVEMLFMDFYFGGIEQDENDYDFTDFSNELINQDFGSGVIKIMDTSKAIKNATVKELKYTNTIFPERDKYEMEDDYTVRIRPEFMW